MTGYDDLKRLAEAVIARELEFPDEPKRVMLVEPAKVLALLADLDEARNGMKFQAALSLKKEIERLNADNASLKGSCSQLGAEHTGMARALKTANRLLTEANAECDQLKVEVEALRKERDKLAEENRSLLEDPGSAL